MQNVAPDIIIDKLRGLKHFDISFCHKFPPDVKTFNGGKKGKQKPSEDLGKYFLRNPAGAQTFHLGRRGNVSRPKEPHPARLSAFQKRFKIKRRKKRKWAPNSSQMTTLGNNFRLLPAAIFKFRDGYCTLRGKVRRNFGWKLNFAPLTPLHLLFQGKTNWRWPVQSWDCVEHNWTMGGQCSNKRKEKESDLKHTRL